MLRILEIAAVIAIVVYGIIKLIEMFSGFRVQRKKGAAMEELSKQAEEVAQKKRDILNQTQQTKEQIDNINNTLN